MTAATPIAPVVFIAGDQDYARPMTVAVRSTSAATPGPVRFVIAGNGLDDKSKLLLERAASPHPTTFAALPGEWFAGLPTDVFPMEMFARLFIDRLIPPGTLRVLYLDGDVLVRSSVTPLMGLDLQGRTVAAAPIGEAPVTASRAGEPPERWRANLLTACGAPSAALQFNSGVMVIDPTRWAELNVPERVKALAKKWVYGDQAYLNAILWDEWLPIGKEWNGKRLDGKIIHFAGRNKPWSPGYFANDFLLEYREVASEVGWDIPLSLRRRSQVLLRAAGSELLPPALRSAAQRLRRSRLVNRGSTKPRWEKHTTTRAEGLSEEHGA